jgi:hypothetical protein
MAPLTPQGEAAATRFALRWISSRTRPRTKETKPLDAANPTARIEFKVLLGAAFSTDEAHTTDSKPTARTPTAEFAVGRRKTCAACAYYF